MNKSDESFNELLAQVIVRGNKMLGESNLMSPFGILLDDNKAADIMTVADETKSYSELLDFLQESMKAKVIDKAYVAGCIVYADYANNQLIAFLENTDNYCLKAVIPVKADDGLSLLPSEMKAEEGGIYIFPVKKSN